jgi:hypothetical protein
MPRILPVSVQENLDGAQEHFDALGSEIMAFGEREPYAIVHEHNADFTKHTLRFQFREPFPAARWGRKFGDGLNSLADALDHLVYAIAIRESGIDPPPDSGILQFPVWTNFQQSDPPMWRVANLSDPVRTAIKAEQPDPSHPEVSLLWQLYQFNSSKKHRVIHMTTTRHTVAQVLVEGLVPGTKTTITWHLVGLENEAPFMTVACAVPSSDVQMGSVAEGLVGVERIGGNGKPEDFLPLGNVCDELTTGAVGIIDRVAEAAGL